MTNQNEVKTDGPSLTMVRQSDDEISLIDIFNFLKEGRVWLFATTAVGFFGGVGYTFIEPPKYQATANIQMAKVADKEVESPISLVEKLKLPLYLSEATIKVCVVGIQNTSGEYLAKSLKPSVNKNAPIVSISFEAKSAKDAEQCVAAVIKDIQSNQNILAKPVIDSKNNQLNTLKQKLEDSEKFRNQFGQKSLHFDFSDAKFSASQLLLSTVLMKDNEINNLSYEIKELQIALEEPQTRSTYLVTPIYAPEQRISPKRTLISLIATLAGLFFGILLLLSRRALKHILQRA